MKEVSENELYEFDRLYYKVAGLYMRFENTHNINHALYKVLHALSISELKTQKEIMQDYEMPKQTVNNIISTLQKQGFIKISLSSNDKRERLLTLSENGQEYAKLFLSEYMAFEKTVANKMGAKKFQKLLESFKELEKALNQELQNKSKH